MIWDDQKARKALRRTFDAAVGGTDPALIEEPPAEARVVAAPALALAAAGEAPTSLGMKPLMLGDALEGEARNVGKVMGGMALSSRSWGLPVGGPAVLLSGGETTVSIGPGPTGKGGRDTELLLSLALALKARDGIWGIAGERWYGTKHTRAHEQVRF